VGDLGSFKRVTSHVEKLFLNLYRKYYYHGSGLSCCEVQGEIRVFILSPNYHQLSLGSPPSSLVFTALRVPYRISHSDTTHHRTIFNYDRDSRRRLVFT